jgi:hypothetical protein
VTPVAVFVRQEAIAKERQGHGTGEAGCTLRTVLDDEAVELGQAAELS